MKPIVVIHGWSDRSESFENLASVISERSSRPVSQLWLGDYISLDDDVKISDITAAMQRAWKAARLPSTANSNDVIVHSTGGLVIRDWMATYWMDKGKKPPVQNLVMLAPANFGSPIAHTGRSVLGRVIKGVKSEKTFNTGTQILKSLEMASTWTWELAQRDRFNSNNAFAKGGVRCTVMVGNTGYSGLRGLVNKDGSDGVVYVATANLNCARIALDFSSNPLKPVSSKIEHSQGKTAFRVLDNFDHDRVKGTDRVSAELLEPLLGALTVTASGFNRWCGECAAATDKVMEKYANKRDAEKHGFQNTVFYVDDDSGDSIDDYAVEFCGKLSNEKDRWAKAFYKNISAKVHVYGGNKAYRSFMIDCCQLYKDLDRIDESLCIRLSAMPDFDDPRNVVGYKTYSDEDIKPVVLDQQSLKHYFVQNRTLLVTVKLKRYQQSRVFRLRRPDQEAEVQNQI